MSSDVPSDALMVALWQKMAELYGHRWLSAYGESTRFSRDKTGEGFDELASAVKTWQRALAGITREELARGVRECERRGDEWPPTAGGFRRLCRPNRQPYERPEFQRRALPKPSDPEVGRQALRKIRSMIGRNRET